MKSVCILLQNQYDGDIRVRRKAEALISAGFSVDVLALPSPHTPERTYTLNGVRVFTVPLGKKRGALIRYAFEYLAFLAWAFFKLSRLAVQRRYAVIDVNNLPDFLVFAALLPKLQGARVVLDMHEITPEFYMSKYGVGANHWQVRLSRWIERLSMAYADHVITINEPIQDLLVGRGLPREKSTVIMNVADESFFAAALGRSEPGLDDEKRDRFVMMYHGTLTRIYGLDIAVEALARVQEELPEAELWILGSGPEKDSLVSLAQQKGLGSRVRFVGTVPPQEIPGWLKRCDVGVLATRQDVFLDLSFSNKLSEYILMDKAVISSRLRTIRHYFSEESMAFFEPDHPTELAKQMVRLHADPQLRQRLAERAKQEYAPIRWEVMRRRYQKLMDDLVGAPSGSGTQPAVAGSDDGARRAHADGRGFHATTKR